MNTSELIIKLKTIKSNNEEWILNGNSLIVHRLERKGLFRKRWVYYDEDERGIWRNYNTFGSENDACNFVYNYALNYWSVSEEERQKNHWTLEESMCTTQIIGNSTVPTTIKQLKRMLKELNIPEHIFSLNNPSSPTSYYMEKRRSTNTTFFSLIWFLYTKDSHGYIRNGQTECFEDRACRHVFLEAKWAMHQNGLYP